MTNAIRIGCSGWVYRDWRGSFYREAFAPRNALRLRALLDA
jgi:uncharacterized protein YecE (DUF72 family)